MRNEVMIDLQAHTHRLKSQMDKHEKDLAIWKQLFKKENKIMTTNISEHIWTNQTQASDQVHGIAHEPLDGILNRSACDLRWAA